MWALLVQFVLLFSACAAVSTPKEGSMSYLDTVQLLENGGAVIVDVRAMHEKESGVPRIATNQIQFGPDNFRDRPASEKEKDEFIDKILKLNTGGKKILLLCTYGVRSESARQALAQSGIEAFSIEGGWLGRNGQTGLKDWKP